MKQRFLLAALICALGADTFFSAPNPDRSEPREPAQERVNPASDGAGAARPAGDASRAASEVTLGDPNMR